MPANRLRLELRFTASVLIGVRQQGQVAGTLHRNGQLALVVRLGAGDAAGNDLAGFGDVALEDAEILVVDALDAFGSEAAELAAAEKAGHGGTPLFVRELEWTGRTLRSKAVPHPDRRHRRSARHALPPAPSPSARLPSLPHPS